VLSIVDNRTFTRLVYEVLDHDPSQEDITRFFLSFRLVLEARGLVLLGITTDGSPLYPEPIRAVFGAVHHQVCEFHVVKEINKAILKAVAQVRRELKKLQPKLLRGRPTSESARKAARLKQRLQEKITALFDYRHLFVQRSLSQADKIILQRITRGLPQLRQLRSVADEVYRLFDRRCRTDTALLKLATLRRRVRCFQTLGPALQKLFSPNIEKALTFLDDALLPSTSNAVERGNRRHRKMQKTIYRVRTREHISQRIAVDMLRDEQAAGRLQTTQTLHYQRKCT
jgi:bifunctional DNA-binding transcriptional regulator/antitoxin component of YhaV-PrlF toxin-antitoxin module